MPLQGMDHEFSIMILLHMWPSLSATLNSTWT